MNRFDRWWVQILFGVMGGGVVLAVLVGGGIMAGVITLTEQ